MTDQAAEKRTSAPESVRFPLVFGLNTFGDRNGDADGKPVSHAQTIRNVVAEGEREPN